jgi:hypothetical protein
MKRTDYLKPTMKVVQLKHQSHILTGSVPASESKGADFEDYKDGGDVDWNN